MPRKSVLSVYRLFACLGLILAVPWAAYAMYYPTCDPGIAGQVLTFFLRGGPRQGGCYWGSAAWSAKYSCDRPNMLATAACGFSVWFTLYKASPDNSVWIGQPGYPVSDCDIVVPCGEDNALLYTVYGTGCLNPGLYAMDVTAYMQDCPYLGPDTPSVFGTQQMQVPSN